jgi:transposase
MSDEPQQMAGEPRVLRPDRRQLRWDTVDLESQLPEDHMARVVWAYAETLDVSSLEINIKARGSNPGRPTPDRRLYVALWLYATLDSIGSARELARLCVEHVAYRWLCGGVPVNHHDLGDFRLEAGDFLDDLLSRSVAALVDEGLVGLECLAVDGVRIRASAGSSSFRSKERLMALHDEANAKVAALREEVDADPGAGTRRKQAAAARAAKEREERIAKAKAKQEEIEQERVKEAESQRRKTVKGKAPRASTTDPEARIMKMADGGFRPAFNAQIKSDPKSGIVVGVAMTDNASDRGQLRPAVEEIEQRYEVTPKQALADGGYDGKDDIEHLHGREAGSVEVFCPIPKSKGKPVPASPRRGEGPGVIAWRQRMSTQEGIDIYRQRFATERPHADMRNRGFTRLLVRGKAKAKAIALWHVTAFNFLQTRFLRRKRGGVCAVAA